MNRTEWKKNHKRFSKNKLKRKKSALAGGKPLERRPLGEIMTRRKNREVFG